MKLYIVKVSDDNGIYEYEHGNLKHAKEHFDMESTAKLIQYLGNNKYITLFSKINKNASIKTVRNMMK